MKFLQELYLGEKTAPKVDQIVKKILAGQEVPKLYLITMASHPDNMLELIPEREILQKGYPKDQLRIIGLADNKKDAIGLTQFIIQECLEQTGSADVRVYLEEKWQNEKQEEQKWA